MSGAYVYTPVERTSRRLGMVLLFLIGGALMVALYYVKMRSQSARADVAGLERQIRLEEAAIDVLIAERAVLANPARLADLSEDRLGLAPITVAQTQSLSAVLEQVNKAQEGQP